VTVRDLVKTLSKAVLLYHSQLVTQPNFGVLWRSMMGGLVAVVTTASMPRGCGSEVLGEAVPESAKNMLLVMHSKVGRGWGVV
jgi:brefeldin A-resistance guanine nucleotide exchange factor 1